MQEMILEGLPLREILMDYWGEILRLKRKYPSFLQQKKVDFMYTEMLKI